MSKIGEFGLIGRISESFSSFRLSPGVTGIGDDCAVLPQRDGIDTLVTTDLLIEDRHFLLGDVSPEDLGWKSAAVNISDIAAMGGRPTATFLSIALPPRIEVGWVERFIGGFRELSARWGVPLLGGDTSASPDKLFINVTVLGECPHGAAVQRSGARPGDLICVTGPLGDSGGGLKLVLERVGREGGAGSGAEQILISRHYRPMPRVDEGMALAAAGVHSMMDISDGIASDLRHILKASGVNAAIDLPAVPLSDELREVCAAHGWDAVELAVSGGEDYELLFTVAPDGLESARAALDGRLYVTGEILPPSGSARESKAPGEIIWRGGAKSDYQGFTHF